MNARQALEEVTCWNQGLKKATVNTNPGGTGKPFRDMRMSEYALPPTAAIGGNGPASLKWTSFGIGFVTHRTFNKTQRYGDNTTMNGWSGGRKPRHFSGGRNLDQDVGYTLFS